MWIASTARASATGYVARGARRALASIDDGGIAGGGEGGRFNNAAERRAEVPESGARALRPLGRCASRSCCQAFLYAPTDVLDPFKAGPWEDVFGGGAGRILARNVRSLHRLLKCRRPASGWKRLPLGGRAADLRRASAKPCRPRTTPPTTVGASRRA